MISCSLIFLLFLLLNFNDARVPGRNYSRKLSIVDDFIAYGRDYDKNKHPYVVSMLIKNSFQCTGTLIKPTFVLTAAHCTWEQKANDIVVIHGAIGLYVPEQPYDYGDIQRMGKNIWQHEEYHNEYSIFPDIAIIEISRPFDCSKYIEIGGNPNEFSSGRSVECIGIGFRIMETGKPPETVGKEYDCRIKHGPKACPSYDDPKIWKMFVCVQQGKKQICSGDSGGPTICNGKQYAIVTASYSALAKPEFDCGDPNVVSMHLFLNFFRDWISAIVGPIESGGGGGKRKEEVYEEDDDSEQEYNEEYEDENTGSTITISTRNYFLLDMAYLCILFFKFTILQL